MTQGQVFGPFICRNHFPFFVNICFALGVGLFLSVRRDPEGSWWNPLELLNDPPALWVSRRTPRSADSREYDRGCLCRPVAFASSR